MRIRRFAWGLGIAAVMAITVAVASADYYRQALIGHTQMMLSRVAIDEVIEQPEVDPALRDRLQLVSRLRDFATQELALPDGDSYRHYAALERDYAVWTVTATPEFSLSPKRWCYPIIGCQTYRSYFDQQRARSTAEALREAGYEVNVGGTSAYSTLGYFEDPVTDVMLQRTDPSLANLIFHELAHERLFVPNDTMFNESYANFVGEEGARQWLRAHNDYSTLQQWQTHREHIATFKDLLMQTRDRLDALYTSDLPRETIREQKSSILQGMRTTFDQQLVGNYPAMARFDSWFEDPVNNARLARVAMYRKWIPAFRGLHEEHDGDWAAFHDAVEELAELPRERRNERLRSYMAEPPTAL